MKKLPKSSEKALKVRVFGYMDICRARIEKLNATYESYKTKNSIKLELEMSLLYNTSG